jgi:hypothetical protein
MRSVPIGLGRACRRGIANGEITVPRVVQEAVVNSYACHFARALPESATGPGDGGRLRLPQRADRAAVNGPAARRGIGYIRAAASSGLA